MPRRSNASQRERLYSAGRLGIRSEVLILSLRAFLLAAAAVLIGSLIDVAGAGESMTYHALGLAGLLAGAALAGWGLPFLAARTGSVVEADLRRRVLFSVITQPARPYRTAEVTNRATEGAAAVGSLAGTFLPRLIAGVVIPLMICVVVATIDLPTGVILLVAVPAVPLLLRMMEKRFTAVTGRYQETADRLTARFLDGVQGMATLKAVNASGEYGRRLEHDSERLRGETMALLRVNQLALLAVDSLFTLGTVVVATGAAMWRLQQGAISHGEAVALVLLGVALIEPMSQIGRFFYVGAIGRASARDIEKFLSDRGHDFTLRTGDGGRIRLDDVTFSYDDGPPVLESVSITIEPGEVVGLVGPSGAGKSTLAGLITGLLTPDSGTVDVDGRVAFVSQQPLLFHGTLRENLLLARPDASGDEMAEVIQAADLMDLVESSDARLDLPVGERGLDMSGGEAQRLTIARMLLTRASIVVLDEPTSNVDLETESRIRAALARLTAGRTVVVIAHRRSTLAGVDRILAVGGGNVADTTMATT